MRTKFGVGAPRSIQDCPPRVRKALERAARANLVVVGRLWAFATALLANEFVLQPRQTPSPAAAWVRRRRYLRERFRG